MWCFQFAGLEGPSQELSQVCVKLLGGALGRLTEGLTVIFSVLTLVGAQIVYWVLMSNFLFNTGEIIYGECRMCLSWKCGLILNTVALIYKLRGTALLCTVLSIHMSLIYLLSGIFLQIWWEHWVVFSLEVVKLHIGYFNIPADAVNGEIHSNKSKVLCPPNVTHRDLGGPDPSTFHRWWQQDLTVPMYLVVPFIFILNLRNAKIFTYFNSLGQ